MPNKLKGLSFAIVPGVYNPMSALLAERAGAKALYLSGGALTSSMGIPDLGLITLDELSGTVQRIREVTDLPLIVDADTGFGEVSNVWRAVRRLERAGADAIQIEDQVMPKKCGHLEGKELIPEVEMREKIRAALDARNEALIIARTDARAVEGVKGMLQRGRAYLEEGADILFPEALTDIEEFRLVTSKMKGKFLANMTEFGKTPYITAEEFRKAGYTFVIFPVTLLRVAVKAEIGALRELLERGTQKGMLDDMITREEQYRIIRYEMYERMHNKFRVKDD